MDNKFDISDIDINLEDLKIDYETPQQRRTLPVITTEESILSCMVQDPSIIPSLIVTEKDFNEYPKVFKFLTGVYKKFDTLNLVFIINLLKKKADKQKVMDLLDKLWDFECSTSNFLLFQEMLIQHNKDNRLQIDNRAKLNSIIDFINKNYYDDAEKINYSLIIENVKEILNK